MEELVPGVDRAAMRGFLRELYAAHAETREERLGYGVRSGTTPDPRGLATGPSRHIVRSI